MRDPWLTLVDSVLRPARPGLEQCLREREQHLAARRPQAEERARALAGCEARIESLRAEVFVAQDGVVTSRMTELEREWRTLSRPDRDGELMDLWARVAPPSWIDRKRWRDSDPAVQVEAAIALAADVEGVEAAEAAIDSLRAALAPWGTPFGPRIRWCASEQDAELTPGLFAGPLREACEALAGGNIASIAFERAQHLRQDVHEAARVRFPRRPLLARDLAHAAFVDFLWRAALAARANPVTPLHELWKTGYVLSAIDPSGVTVEIPPL